MVRQRGESEVSYGPGRCVFLPAAGGFPGALGAVRGDLIAVFTRPRTPPPYITHYVNSHRDAAWSTAAGGVSASQCLDRGPNSFHTVVRGFVSVTGDIYISPFLTHQSTNSCIVETSNFRLMP